MPDSAAMVAGRTPDGVSEHATARRRPAGTRVVRGLAVRTLLVALPVLLVAACGSGDQTEGSERSGSASGASTSEQQPGPAADEIETWQLNNTERGEYDYGLGAWLHQDVVVHATTTDVLAVDLETGKEAWRFEPPAVDGKSAEFCGASERVVDGKLALAYGVGGEPEPGVRRHCTNVLLLDLATQRPAWSKSFMGGEDDVDSLSLPQQVAYVEPIGEDSVESVMVGYLRYLRAFDASGNELWHNHVAPAEGSPADAHCSIGDLSTDGPHVAVLSSCTRAPNSVLWIDPEAEEVARRGRLQSSAIGDELAAGGILRTGPTVLSLMLENRTFEYVTLDEAGSVDQVIENPADSGTEQFDFSAKSSPDGAQTYYRQAFGENLLATVTVGDLASNKLTLLDLANGEQRWKQGLGIGWKFQPIAVEQNGVLALAVGETDGILRLVRASLADGELETLQEVKVPSEVIGPASSAVLLTDGERLVGVDLGNRSSRPRAVLFSFPLKG